MRYIVCMQEQDETLPTGHKVPGAYRQVEQTGISEFDAALGAIMEHRPKRVVWVQKALPYHGHFNYMGRDCDGRHQSWHSFLLDPEVVAEHGTEGALERLVQSRLPTHTDFRFEAHRDALDNLHLTVIVDGDEGGYSNSWNNCDDGMCPDFEVEGQSDQFARLMNY